MQDTDPPMGSSDPIRVPLPLRTHEKNQLDEYVPVMIEETRDLGLGETADELESMTLEIEPAEDIAARHRAFATADEWRKLVSSLQYVSDGLRPKWLRKKLALRLHTVLDELTDTEERANDATTA